MTPSEAPFWPGHLPHHLEIPKTTVHYNLEVSAHRYPDKPLAIFYDTPLTYGAAWRQARALAGFLRHRCGVGRRDRVLLFMQNCPQFIVAYYAILQADAIVVPVNPMNLQAELRHFATDAGARTIVLGQELFPRVAGLVEEGVLDHAIVTAYGDYATVATDLPVPDAVRAPRERIDTRGVTLWPDALEAGLDPGASVTGPDNLCVMPYTSGTTGLPKGCVHTHGSVMFNIVAGACWFGQVPDAVLLATLPYFHVTGMQGSMNSPIFSGATIVLMQRWDRDVAARLIERYRVQTWTNIATMAIDFLANPDLGQYDLSSLRRISGGGAAMPEAVARRILALTGVAYTEGYGLTETMAPTHINPPDRPKMQCLGIPIFDTDARIVNPDTLAELPPGETGEIVVRGPQVFQGYWNATQATDDAFVDIGGQRFFRTGDLGRMDEEGYFFLVDRLKRMINAAGFKVWPAEVEATLYGHPAIQEACVIATPDETRGESVKALVVLRDRYRGNVTEQEIVEWSRGQMAAYKIPRSVEFVDHLPKSGTGKVQWRQLQEREWRPPS